MVQRKKEFERALRELSKEIYFLKKKKKEDIIKKELEDKINELNKKDD